MLGPLFKRKEKNLEPMKTSPGKLRSYIQCPYKYKQIQVDGQKVDSSPSPHLEFDKLANSLVESWQKKQHGTTQAASRESIRQVMMNTLEAQWNPDRYTDQETANEFYQFALNTIDQMADWFVNNTGQSFNYRNKPSIGMFAPWYPRPLTIWTRLDRVEKNADGTVRVIDFKSGARETTAAEMKTDLGLRLQAAAGRELFGDALTHIAYVYLRTGHTVQVSLEDMELEFLKADIMHIARKIQNGHFEPNLGPLCSVCEFQPECPGWKSRLPWVPAGETRETFGNRLRLSYSKMSLYERCPRAYHKLYHESVPPKPQPFFSFGSCIHAIMEDFYDGSSREKPTWDRMMSIMDEQWRNFRIGYRSDEEEEKYKTQARAQLELFFNQFVRGQKFKPAYFIEKYFELPIGNDSIMTGFIDRIDKLPGGGYVVLDYKTEPTDRTQEAVDKDLQLTLYYWASREFLNLDIKKLGLFMMSHDKLMTTTRTPEDIPVLMDRVIEVTRQIRAEEEFAPKMNKYCRSCDHLDDCPLRHEIKADTTLRTMEFTDSDMEQETS